MSFLTARRDHATTYSVESEQAILGALLIRPDSLWKIDFPLNPEHFHREDHGRIYRCIQGLISAGKTVDVLTVFEDLESRGEAERCGGLAYLGEIANNTPSAANIRRYAEIVVERALLRDVLAAADEISAKVLEPGPAGEKVGFAQARIMALSDRAEFGARDPQRVSDLLPDYLDRLEARWEGTGDERVPTGIPDLDKRLNGGPAEGALVILAGRPGMGKTVLGMQIAENVAREGMPALVLSQEMPNSQLIDRALATLGRIPLDKIQEGGLSEEQHERLFDAAARLQSMPLYLDEQGALRLDDVRRKARKVAQSVVAAGGRLRLIVIDYLQLMVGDAGAENRQQEITRISGGLKALAKELRIPIIALSQLSRKCEERPNKRPIASDLRESGAIEQDADVILFAYRDDQYNPDSIHKGLAELIVSKNRMGEAGGFVPLVFHGQYSRFDPMFGEWPKEVQESAKKPRRGFHD